MITNSKTPIKSTRQKRADAMKKRIFRKFVKNFDAYMAEIEKADDPKTKRMIELGKKHMPLSKIMEIVDKEFPEE